jgi:hypothetical protein
VRTLTVVAVGLPLIILAHESAAQQGAKALFLDPSSGAAVSATPRPNGKANTATSTNPAAAVVTNTGLMYYMELGHPDGTIERVGPATVFHSGDKIRIQLQSNADGRLVIAQRNADGTSGILFPDARINGGDNLVRAGQTTALPSPDAWFRFDQNPGEERLLVTLTRQVPGASPTSAALPREWDRKRTDEVTQLAQAQKGSKALVIEVDHSREAPATYIVQPAGQTGATGAVTAEIVLIHK